MLKEYIPSDQDVLQSANIATYELGYLIKGLLYAKRHQQAHQELDVKAYNAEARLGLTDLINVCRIIAEQLNLDFDELVADGEERFLERMEQVKNKHLH